MAQLDIADSLTVSFNLDFQLAMNPSIWLNSLTVPKFQLPALLYSLQTMNILSHLEAISKVHTITKSSMEYSGILRNLNRTTNVAWIFWIFLTLWCFFETFPNLTQLKSDIAIAMSLINSQLTLYPFTPLKSAIFWLPVLLSPCIHIPEYSY